MTTRRPIEAYCPICRFRWRHDQRGDVTWVRVYCAAHIAAMRERAALRVALIR